MEYVILLGITIMILVWILGIIFLKKDIDTTIAVVYGIYGLSIIIFWIFVLIGLKLGLIIN